MSQVALNNLALPGEDEFVSTAIEVAAPISFDRLEDQDAASFSSSSFPSSHSSLLYGSDTESASESGTEDPGDAPSNEEHSDGNFRSRKPRCSERRKARGRSRESDPFSLLHETRKRTRSGSTTSRKSLFQASPNLKVEAGAQDDGGCLGRVLDYYSSVSASPSVERGDASKTLPSGKSPSAFTIFGEHSFTATSVMSEPVLLSSSLLEDQNETQKSLANNVTRELTKVGVLVSPEKIGFKNIGNTCYMNSVFQCLFAIPMFVRGLEFITQRFVENPKLTEEVRTKLKLTKIFSTICRQKTKGGTHEMELTAFEERFRNICKTFEKNVQQDAHEFLVLLFEKLNEELEYVGGLFSPAKSIFEYRLKETKICQKCNHTKESMEIGTVLNITSMLPKQNSNLQRPKTGIKSLQCLMKKALQSQIKMLCEKKCKSVEKEIETDGEKKKVIEPETTSHKVFKRFVQLPKVLIILLSRIDPADITKKTKQPVKIPRILSLTDVSETGNCIFSSIDDWRMELLKKSPRSPIKKLPSLPKHSSLEIEAILTAIGQVRSDELKKQLRRDLGQLSEALSNSDLSSPFEDKRLEQSLDIIEDILTTELQETISDDKKTSNQHENNDISFTASQLNSPSLLEETGANQNCIDSSSNNKDICIKKELEEEIEDLKKSWNKEMDAIPDDDDTNNKKDWKLDADEDDSMNSGSSTAVNFDGDFGFANDFVGNLETDVEKSDPNQLPTSNTRPRSSLLHSLGFGFANDFVENLETNLEKNGPNQLSTSRSRPRSSLLQSLGFGKNKKDQEASLERTKDKKMSTEAKISIDDIFDKERPNDSNLLHEYQWTGVVKHLGEETAGGHYVASVFSTKKQKWFHYDDAVVKETNMQSIIKDSATKGYLYFYTHEAYLSDQLDSDLVND